MNEKKLGALLIQLVGGKENVQKLRIRRVMDEKCKFSKYGRG